MQEPKSFKDKLRAAIAGKDLPSEGWGRLALLIASLAAAKAVFRLALSLLLVAGIVFWVLGRYNSGGPEQAAEARRLAEETKRMVDEAHDKAEANQQTAWIRKQEEAIEHAVHSVALAMTGRDVDMSQYGGNGAGLTDNLDDLIDYGFRRNPDLIYDVQLFPSVDGHYPTYTVYVRHREKGPRAFIYDSARGAAVAAGEQSGPVNK